VRRRWHPGGFQAAGGRPPERAAGQSAPRGSSRFPAAGRSRGFLAQTGPLIESAPAYRYLRCMRGMYILPREATAAVTRPAGHFVGLCDGHTFRPMMQ
jgi:hypothetical protein